MMCTTPHNADRQINSVYLPDRNGTANTPALPHADHKINLRFQSRVAQMAMACQSWTTATNFRLEEFTIQNLRSASFCRLKRIGSYARISVPARWGHTIGDQHQTGAGGCGTPYRLRYRLRAPWSPASAFHRFTPWSSGCGSVVRSRSSPPPNTSVFPSRRDESISPNSQREIPHDDFGKPCFGRYRARNVLPTIPQRISLLLALFAGQIPQTNQTWHERNVQQQRMCSAMRQSPLNDKEIIEPRRQKSTKRKSLLRAFVVHLPFDRMLHKFAKRNSISLYIPL